MLNSIIILKIGDKDKNKGENKYHLSSHNAEIATLNFSLF